MSMLAQFENEVGKNIQLSDKNREAKWSPSQSGGWAYSACVMKPGNSVLVALDGSGHCDVGFIKEDPNRQGSRPEELVITKLNCIKLHKRTCKITITLKDNGKEVYSTFEGDPTSKKLHKSTPVWIAVYVKFGNVAMEIYSNGSLEDRIPLSVNHGPNIQLDAGNHKASTVSVCPASSCLVKLNAGEIIKLKCNPVTDGSRDPSRYHLKLHFTDSSPSELMKYCPQMFDAQAIPGRAPPITPLEILEKQECKGNVNISFSRSSIIEYTTASNKRNTQTLQYVASDGIWIVIELFRVSVVIIEKTSIHTTMAEGAVRNQTGEDVVDSCVREPLNEFAENSFNLLYTRSPSTGAADQDYVSVTQAKEIMNTTDIINRERQSHCDNNVCDASIVQRLERLEATQSQMAQAQADIYFKMKGNASPQLQPCPSCYISSHVTAVDEIDIQTNRVQLINTMRADRLCDHLFEKKVIGQQDMDELLTLNNSSQNEANRKLLKILKMKQVRKAFMGEILKDAEEAHLIPLMFPK